MSGAADGLYGTLREEYDIKKRKKNEHKTIDPGNDKETKYLNHLLRTGYRG